MSDSAVETQEMDTQQVNYSPEFKALIEDPQKAKALIEGSFVTGEDFKDWENGRRFIVDAIDRDGTILDIGCANGFLLRCLQEWSGHKLIPYGVDIDHPSIEAAKQLFPGQADNFFEEDSDNLASNKSITPFNFIYWNVQDNYQFSNPRSKMAIKGLFENTLAPGGRIILGFYDQDLKAREEKIKQIEEMGFEVGGHIKDPKRGEKFIWIDKPKET